MSRIDLHTDDISAFKELPATTQLLLKVYERTYPCNDFNYSVTPEKLSAVPYGTDNAFRLGIRDNYPPVTTVPFHFT